MQDLDQFLGDQPCADRIRIAVSAFDAKQGDRIVVMDMREALGVIDAFIVVHGHNTPQVRALVDESHDRLKAEAGDKPLRVEGLSDASWILVDYGDLVLHVFNEATRDFFDLEHLWSQVPQFEVPSSLPEEVSASVIAD